MNVAGVVWLAGGMFNRTAEDEFVSVVCALNPAALESDVPQQSNWMLLASSFADDVKGFAANK
jgi:hypothetical protein